MPKIAPVYYDLNTSSCFIIPTGASNILFCSGQNYTAWEVIFEYTVPDAKVKGRLLLGPLRIRGQGNIHVPSKYISSGAKEKLLQGYALDISTLSIETELQTSNIITDFSGIVSCLN